MSLIYQADSQVGGIRPGLYLGGKDDAQDQQKLERWRVTHILNVTPPKGVAVKFGVPNYFESSGAFVYQRIPVLDEATSASDMLHAADDIVSFIAGGLCHGSVLVHCYRGISRSTTAVLFYLMRRVGMSLNDGLNMIKRRRPKVKPIAAFIKILEQYENQCFSDANGEKEGNQPRRSTKRKLGPSLSPSASLPTPEPVSSPNMTNPLIPSPPFLDSAMSFSPTEDGLTESESMSQADEHQEDRDKSCG